MNGAQTKYDAFFNLLESPNEHPIIDCVSSVSSSEKFYVHIWARWKLMVTECYVSESCFFQCFWNVYILMDLYQPPIRNGYKWKTMEDHNQDHSSTYNRFG